MIKLKSLLTEAIKLPNELKDTFRKKPYDPSEISKWIVNNSSNVKFVGYSGYDVYKFTFSSKQEMDSIRGMELKKLVSKLYEKGGKGKVVYVQTKKPISKPGMHIGGDGYFDVK